MSNPGNPFSQPSSSTAEKKPRTNVNKGKNIKHWSEADKTILMEAYRKHKNLGKDKQEILPFLIEAIEKVRDRKFDGETLWQRVQNVKMIF